MKRMIFALVQGWKARKGLRKILATPAWHYPTVCALKPIALHNRGIFHLVLDFDGVLAGHGEPYPCPAAEAWLDHWCAQWPPAAISILTNKPMDARAWYFQQRYPGMRFIQHVEKKPYPAGLLHLLRVEGLEGAQVVLVDDRLLTGMLAALLAGVQVCYITRPFQSALHPMKEIFFQVLRYLERGVLGFRLPRVR